MATDRDDRDSQPPTEAEAPEMGEGVVRAADEEVVDGGPSELVGDGVEDADQIATQLGATKYVHAAFFVAGILAAYLGGKVLLALWNSLADWPAAVRSLPFLIQYTEEERGSLTLGVGAVFGILLILHYYRQPRVRQWANEIASELSRVTWPDKETVTNGTLVVLIAGAVGTVYVALLDRFWGYLTNLIYGA